MQAQEGAAISKIAIIACDHFKRELEALVEGDEDFVIHDYLEYHLHEDPLKLRDVVIERINALEGQVDAVLLGYGTCGSLDGIESAVRVPTAMFKAEDCIGVYLTQEVYDRERKKAPFTYYSTPYFSDMDMDWHARDWERKMGMQLEPEMFKMMFAKMFDGYTRSIYVHTIGERECFEKKALKFADELSLSFETRDGTLSVMKDAIARAKELASKAAERREEES
jgi:hypothetical protein